MYRKLTSGQFCSTGHQKAYWKEQERLAVEVLHRTHDALMAYKPQEDIELIIGPAVGWNGQNPVASTPPKESPRPEPVRSHIESPPEAAPISIPDPSPPPFAGFVTAISSEEIAPSWTVLPLLVAADPAEYESDLASLVVRHTGESGLAPSGVNALPLADAPVRVPVKSATISWVGLEPASLPGRMAAPVIVPSRLEPQTPEPEPIPEETLAPELPSIADMAVYAQPIIAPQPMVSQAPVVFIDRTLLEQIALPQGPPAFLEFDAPLAMEPEPVDDIEAVPPLGGWQHNAASIASVSWNAALASAESIPPRGSIEKPTIAAALQNHAMNLGGLQRLSLHRAESHPAPHAISATWLPPGASNPPQLIDLSLTAVEPRPRMAGGSRYGMKRTSQPPVAIATRLANLTTASPAVKLPERSEPVESTFFAPNMAGLVSLSDYKKEISGLNIKLGPPRDGGSGQAIAPSNPCFIPRIWLQPIRWAPGKPAAPAPAEEPKTPAPTPLLPAPPEKRPEFGHLLLGFWKNAPRDLRLLVFAIPALLALAFHPTLPKVHVSTVQATEPVQRNVGQAVNGSWTQFKQVVADRAAIALDEDFRSGLDDWSSPGGVATEWSFDANGFVRPGSLALYSPSLSLADYELQFLGIIDQKSLSWVVRAADFSNYYVVKLVVVKPGPLTTLGLTRYAVIDGKPQDRVDAVVPFTARPDMIYRVRMDVHDDSFVLAIQGQIVDAWSQTKLKKGGIGFFSARGEGSRVRWLQVTHQYDMLGRLCSYLAPYDLSATDIPPVDMTRPTETTTKNNSTNGNGSLQR